MVSTPSMLQLLLQISTSLNAQMFSLARPTFLLCRRILILLNHSDYCCVSSQRGFSLFPEYQCLVNIAEASHRGARQPYGMYRVVRIMLAAVL